jgi:hypothetical protein
MKNIKLDNLLMPSQILSYDTDEICNSSDVEDLHKALVSADHFLNIFGLARNRIYNALQNKMPKGEQMSLDFGAYTYEIVQSVKKNFISDFGKDTETEAQFLEDNGLGFLVTREEKIVNTVKIDNTKKKKLYQKNQLPEFIASHYSFEEESNLKVLEPKVIVKQTSTEEEE